jgi:hypothetical protein
MKCTILPPYFMATTPIKAATDWRCLIAFGTGCSQMWLLVIGSPRATQIRNYVWRKSVGAVSPGC